MPKHITQKARYIQPKNIEQDLQKIDAWLDMLASNLPNTSAWMTCLMSLSEVQKFSAAKYYQVNYFNSICFNFIYCLVCIFSPKYIMET
ncbi:unnamed protein product [Trichobilharzia regenti]|nr:unnamed protein product [Trichobilharzia regenti]